MQRRVFRQAAAAALAILLVTAATVSAETVTADGDAVTLGDQTTIDLGTARPGADVPVDVTFRLSCTGTDHLDPGQAVRLTPGPRTIPAGGSFGVGSAMLTPGAGWPTDGSACPAGLAPATTVLHMIVTATPEPATDLVYTFSWNRALAPTTAGDPGVLEGANPSISFLLDVVDDTPPTLVVPADSTVEGDTTGGAIAAYVVSAADVEDATPPTPVCAPAVGVLLPLGTTTVRCTAQDSAGLSDTGSFTITVIDTTAPILASLADVEVTTSDPAGAALSYGLPGIADIVDAWPTVACLPASGATFPVGTTTVTCTATDASGNHSSTPFTATVRLVPVVAWSARWGEPIGANGSTFDANAGRTIPVKVELFADGVEQVAGQATLAVATCVGAPVLSIGLRFEGGRWTGHLDTGALGGGCFTATARLDGAAVGSLRLELRGDAAAAHTVAPGKGSKRA